METANHTKYQRRLKQEHYPTTMEENLPQVQENQAQNGPPYTVMDAMILCGVDNINNHNGQTAAERLRQIFSVIHSKSVWIKPSRNFKMISNSIQTLPKTKDKSE